MSKWQVGRTQYNAISLREIKPCGSDEGDGDGDGSGGE